MEATRDYAAEYAAERAMKDTLVRDAVDGIAAHLDGWNAEYPEDRSPRLVNSDGVAIWVRLETDSYVLPDRWRLSMSAGVPDGASYSDGDYGRDKQPQVTVNPHRPVDKLAKDVARRLLPGAVEYHAAIVGRMARRLSAQDAREVFATELAALLGGRAVESNRDGWRADLPTITHESADGHTRHLYGDITPDYDASTARAELRGMTADQARELATLVAGWRA